MALLGALALLGGCSGPDPTLLPSPMRDSGIEGGGAAPPTPDDAGSTLQPPPTAPASDGGPLEVDGAAPPLSIDCDQGEEFSVCTRPNADSACLEEQCLIVRCLGDFVDCDGDPDNGCETTLETTAHCGRCGASCSLPNVARHRCELIDGAGRCSIDHGCPEGDAECMPGDPANGCKAGFGDCDGSADNGCERPLDTLSDCGACDDACKSSTSVLACEGGRCQAVGCAPGFGDCDGKGCESLAEDVDHCGDCGQACPVQAMRCAGGRCTGLTCSDDLADCNGEVADGCEADLTRTQTCGNCDNACPSYDNASAACNGGSCAIDRCDDGYADCNGDAQDGCEVDLGRVQSCGGCGVDCTTLPHVAGADCGSGGCANLVCESGWGDCDGDAQNGCERPLNTTRDCGGCGERCGGENATASCASGSCELTACDDGWDDCNGQVADGCEASLSDPASCGGCGNDCGDGGACVDDACQCATSAGCPNGLECCAGGCVNTRSDCFPWPCIPGTVADAANCGACGRQCGLAALFCCLVF